MTDTKSGKTLTLKKKPAAKAPADADAPRKRSGSRARVASQRQREHGKATPVDASGRQFVTADARAERPARAGQAGSAPAGRPPAAPRRSTRPSPAEPAEYTPRKAPAEAARRPLRAPSADTSSRTSPAAPKSTGARSPRTPAAAAPSRREVSLPGDPHGVMVETRQAAPRRPRPAPGRARRFEIFAPCPTGLEEALAAELQALGFDDASLARAGCRFSADWTGVLRANLYSRLATRILVELAHSPVDNEDDILDLAHQTPWEDWFGPQQTLRVDTSAIRSPMQSLQYCNLRVKDGICDRLREQEGARPDIDTVRPDARVHLFLDETSATLYLDTSGESLFKRGWRLDKGEAPLRENLAAGLLALSDWDPSAPLLDPFCGSGTILIEAAWIALGVPPGIWRPFGFERLRHHDARHWRDLKDDARTRIATQIDTPLVGYDIDPRAIEAARANLERAWLTPDTIRFETGDARTVPPPAPEGWIVTNPPYGERLPGDTTLWADWASNLKQHYSGWRVNIISSDHDLPRHLRLKPLRRYPLHNGALDCRLFTFEMVQASYRKDHSGS
ncbi:class I SAM-dependent RNA methyltransferase [Pusillimonas sp. TS35]|nr:class I SAM-dependent RNA methyltransferase [Pusillimonas sp. TS35]